MARISSTGASPGHIDRTAWPLPPLPWEGGTAGGNIGKMLVRVPAQAGAHHSRLVNGLEGEIVPLRIVALD